MSKKDIKDVLKGQDLPVDSTMAILRGAVARLDFMVETIKIMEPFLMEGPDDTGVAQTMLEWKESTEAYLVEMGVAKLFTGMVLKLQKPVFSNEVEPLYLAYNEDRSLMEHMHASPEVEAFFQEGVFKVFVFARLWKDGTLQLVSEAGWQEW